MQSRILWPTLAATLLAGTAFAQPVSLKGEFTPMNTGVQPAQNVTGTISAQGSEGETTIELEVSGLSPGMHMAHLHGFQTEDPQAASCPGEDADANGDGIVDLIETEEAAGVTLIPLTDDPASLSIESDAYPVADEDGKAAYRQTVDLIGLEEAMGNQYGTSLALEKRVVFIHGVPEGAELPDSVASLEGVPASATLPIACAELRSD